MFEKLFPNYQYFVDNPPVPAGVEDMRFYSGIVRIFPESLKNVVETDVVYYAEFDGEFNGEGVTGTKEEPVLVNVSSNVTGWVMVYKPGNEILDFSLDIIEPIVVKTEKLAKGE
ncbi:MAG: hypothetical protein QW328_08730 [Nitrososphaerota archaeon]